MSKQTKPPPARRGRTETSWAWENLDHRVGTLEAPAGLQRAWRSPLYLVQLYHLASRDARGFVEVLMVRRRDGRPVREWTHLQRIKDELVGPERTAVEVYPARADVVDTAHMYHLWLIPPGERLAFGLHLPGNSDIVGA